MATDGFSSPYVDLDEWRTTPCRHRYIHGGFEETDTRFSFYLPPAEQYEGRFVTVIEGGQGGHEDRAARLSSDRLPSIEWAFGCGAMLVESNGGHIAPGPVALTRAPHPAEVTAYAATAAATQYARDLATEMYGERPGYGYVIGGSGGGRALLALENTEGIWDGCVQWINAAGHGVSMPTVVMNAVRVLGPAIHDVAAAFEPGGTRDPFHGLTSAQSEALATLYRSGFQPGSEFQLEQPGPELAVLQITKTLAQDYDPEYFDDFWEKPGHLGADGELDDDVLVASMTVARLESASGIAPEELVRFSGLGRGGPPGPSTLIGIAVSGASARFVGAEIVVASGAAAGRRLLCIGVLGDVLVVDFASGGDLAGVAQGDQIDVDNRRFLAYLYSYRHQVDPDAPESTQFMVGGAPLYPQRDLGLQDVLVGIRMKAEFEGKVIYVGSVNDSLSTPTGWPVTYAGQVRERFGNQATECLRVWLNDRATHLQGSERPPGPPPVASTRLVDWIGSVEQAVADLIGWVERNEAPPPDTAFTYADGRMLLAPSAPARGGIQPVVVAHVDGEETTTVAAGAPVALTVAAEVPPGAGTVVRVEWDFDGHGTWPFALEGVDGSADHVEATVEHVFDVPGRYFPSVRVTAHRDGDLGARRRLVPGLARVRVDVTP